jgi:hypothetical protein
MELDLDWEPALCYRRGAPTNLDDVHVFYDFDWLDVFPDNRAQFRNGKCLAQHVREECPEGKTPALLLTTQDRAEQSLTTDAFHVVIVNIHKYLELADADAALSYFASRSGTGVAGFDQLRRLVTAPEDVKAFLELKLTPELIRGWIQNNRGRAEAVRKVIGADPGHIEGAPASPQAALEALAQMGEVDLEVATAIGALFGPDSDRAIRLDLLRALTAYPAGRLDASEVLGQRTRERLEDLRKATREYKKLLVDPESGETTLQSFIEEHIWLLGLDYANARPRKRVPRGQLDFILERFDGFHDLLELKSPQDRIIEVKKKAEDGVPASASAYSLSRRLADALAQVMVYREVLSANPSISDEHYGLAHSREPRLVIVIGRVGEMDPYCKTILRELNGSLHRVEIVPYDVLGKRAEAAVASIDQLLREEASLRVDG